MKTVNINRLEKICNTKLNGIDEGYYEFEKI